MNPIHQVIQYILQNPLKLNRDLEILGDLIRRIMYAEVEITASKLIDIYRNEPSAHNFLKQLATMLPTQMQSSDDLTIEASPVPTDSLDTYAEYQDALEHLEAQQKASHILLTKTIEALATDVGTNLNAMCEVSLRVNKLNSQCDQCWLTYQEQHKALVDRIIILKGKILQYDRTQVDLLSRINIQSDLIHDLQARCAHLLTSLDAQGDLIQALQRESANAH